MWASSFRPDDPSVDERDIMDQSINALSRLPKAADLCQQLSDIRRMEQALDSVRGYELVTGK